MAIQSRKKKEGNGYQSWTSEFFDRHFPIALVGHRSVFTHSDLQRKNILVSKSVGREAEAANQQGRWRDTVMVDWEDAGCFIHFCWDDDWPEKFESIIDRCPLEAGLLRFVRQDLEY